MNYTHRILQVLNKPIKDGLPKYTYKKHRKVICGWEIGINIPQHLSYEEAEKALPALVATCGKELELIGYKGLVVVRIIEKPMSTKIPFKPHMIEGLKPSEILIGYNVLGERITFDWSLPHGIVAAETGMGKTDFLRLMIYCLLHDPQPVDIRLIDMKMLSFLPFRKVPNITLKVGWKGAEGALLAAAAEVEKRNADVFASGSRRMTKTLRKIVVIVDEAAEIALKAATLPEEKAIAKKIEKAIITIARMGREVNVHLIYCTQYPTADIVSNQIRINCGMRLCFYVPELTQSEVVLQRGGAENLQAIPGRAIFKSNQYQTVQVPFVGDDDIWERMLIKFRTEVIEDGSSKRSDTQRTYTEGTFTSTDSENRSDSKTVYKQLKIETGQREPERAGTGETGGIRMGKTGKGMAPHYPRLEVNGDLTDEI